MSARVWPLAVVACTALACATARTPPPERITFGEGDVVEADPAAAALAGKNDAELFAIATAAEQRRDDAAAAAAFGRLADAFPASPRAGEARYRAGLAYSRMGAWGPALERFRQVATGSDAESKEAAFLSGEALYHLGRDGEARACFGQLAEETDLDALERARALTQRGVLELEDGEPELAERSLRAAIDLSPAPGALRSGERYYPAKARFYLGEVVRSRFEAVKLDPAHGDATVLADRLAQRSALLLQAQEDYLDAIRSGEPEWAVAGSARIGELYDELQRDMTEAPLPPGLDGDAARVYRQELRSRLRVLVTKAIDAYQETLAAARRAGVESAFVPRTEAALERMQHTLAETEAAQDAPDVGR